MTKFELGVGSLVFIALLRESALDIEYQTTSSSTSRVSVECLIPFAICYVGL